MSKYPSNGRAFALKPLPWIVGLLAAGVSTLTQAQLTHNITLGNPKALALGNAVTADPPGVDSIHFNPAGLAKIKGRESSIKLLAARLSLQTRFGTQNAEEEAKAFNEAYGCNTRPGGQCFQPDNLQNTSSSTSTPALMLPGAGLTTVPGLIVPFGGIAIEDTDYGWTFATAFYSPESVGFERKENDPGAFQGYRVATSRLTYFAPSVGLEITDEIAVGASIGFSWQGFGIETKFRAPEQTLAFVGGTLSQQGVPQSIQDSLALLGPYDNVGNLSIEMEDPMSLSFNLGMLWQPYEYLSFGIAYKSESTSNLQGDYKMDNSDNFLATTTSLKKQGLTAGLVNFLADASLVAEPVESGSISLDYRIPQTLAVGTSVRLFPRVKFNADLKWIDYSVWDSLDLKFDKNVDFLTVSAAIERLAGNGQNDADPNELRMPRGYEDAVNVALGLEYQYDDATVLRFGYEPRTSSIPKDKLDVLLPIGEADLFAIGGGYRLDRYTKLDAAFGYMVSKYDLPSGSSTNANSTQPGDVVYNPYAYLDISGKTEAFLLAFSYDQRF
jgi:long-subunit fatty acid transport protein